MGVRAGEDEWKRELNSQIRRNQEEIDAILRDAGVPILDDFGKGEKPAGDAGGHESMSLWIPWLMKFL